MLTRIRPCCIPLFMIGATALLVAQTPDTLPTGQRTANDQATLSSSSGGNTSENPEASSAAELGASDPKASVASTGPSWDWTQHWQPKAAPEFLQPFQPSLTDVMNAWVWNQAQGASNNISLFAAGVKENPGGAAAAAVDTSLTVFGALVDPSLELTFASAGASFTNGGLNASFTSGYWPTVRDGVSGAAAGPVADASGIWLLEDAANGLGFANNFIQFWEQGLASRSRATTFTPPIGGPYPALPAAVGKPSVSSGGAALPPASSSASATTPTGSSTQPTTSAGQTSSQQAVNAAYAAVQRCYAAAMQCYANCPNALQCYAPCNGMCSSQEAAYNAALKGHTASGQVAARSVPQKSTTPESPSSRQLGVVSSAKISKLVSTTQVVNTFAPVTSRQSALLPSDQALKAVTNHLASPMTVISGPKLLVKMDSSPMAGTDGVTSIAKSVARTPEASVKSLRAPMHPNVGIIALPNKVELMKQSAVPQSPPRLIVKMDSIPSVGSPSFPKLEVPNGPLFAMPLIQTQPRLLVKADSIQLTEPASSPTLFQAPKLSGGMDSVPLLQRAPHPTLGIGTFPIINPATPPTSSTLNIVQPARRLSPAVPIVATPTPAPRPTHK